MIQRMRFPGSRSRIGSSLAVLALSGLVGACDGLLDVNLPHLLTDSAVGDPSTAEVQVNSAIALFECGYSAFGQVAGGHEDLWDPQAGNFRVYALYMDEPSAGDCDASDLSIGWFNQITGARSMLTTNPELLTAPGQPVTAEGRAQGVYDRLQSEWALGQEGERLSAISALYVAASLAHLGEFMCEVAIDGSDLMTPPQVMEVANAWIDRTLGHIQAAGGDFAMPFGIAPSAEYMALAIRARILWANGDLAAANAAATDVLSAFPQFESWVTRDTGPTRRNKIHVTNTVARWSSLLGVNDWWNPAHFAPNPATGEPWPSPIPFTGYLFLGIEPDGRTLEPGNTPVRWAEEFRELGAPPRPIAGSDAVPDTRVRHFKTTMAGPEPGEVPDKYGSDAVDIPYMTWRELLLIQADYELHSQGNTRGAIDRVNVLRAHHGLPQISGAYEATLLGDPGATREMLLEERRREFFNEGGRYWSTKIQNTDLLWFPRFQGNTPLQGYPLEGGVRMLWINNEYEGNPHWAARGGLGARGTGCADLGSLGGNPGSQVPVF